MLGPKTIAVSAYPVATKPLLGFEQQLYVTTQPFTDLGILTVTALNSGTYTASAANNALLATAPQQLLCICETTDVLGAGPLVVQAIGTDLNGNPLSGVATFTPPGYAQDKSYDICQHRAAEFLPYQSNVYVDGTAFKTITSIVPIGADATYTNARFRVVGMPAVSAFIKIGTKINLEIDPKIQEPVAIQDGSDKGAFIKPGEIPVGSLTISTKEPSSADGLRRYSGHTLTGLVQEVKQDFLPTQSIYIGGLYIAAKPKGSEGQEAVTLECTAMYQRIGSVLAQ